DELADYLTAVSLLSLALTSLISKICPSIIYNERDSKKLGLLDLILTSLSPPEITFATFPLLPDMLSTFLPLYNM
ncbi:hypothetical protein M1O51_04595, partial [Dehalococcoidia bacterium]|nr:hypothetical protein [Dehalococcoidia bacterium]